MKPYHEIGHLRFSGGYMILTIDEDEKQFRINTDFRAALTVIAI